MKAELIHAIHELQANKEGLHSIVISPSGRVLAVYRWGSEIFRDLDEFETCLYRPKPAPPSEEAL
jgi:hypothetical protein